MNVYSTQFQQNKLLYFHIGNPFKLIENDNMVTLLPVLPEVRVNINAAS